MHAQSSIALRLTSATTAAAGALVLLTACVGGGDTASSGYVPTPANNTWSPTPTPSSPATASINDADVLFVQMMIPHHQQAVEMAQLAQSRATDPEIKELADEIEETQEAEIETLRDWLKDWGKPLPTGDMERMPGMPGMMSDEKMRALREAKGTDFDKQFTEMMIAHHKGAIQMAETEQAKGRNPDVKRFAMSVASSQQAQILQLQRILERL
ncbi:lipoprotein [Acrocarpospora phusangensis]|uniref:Lipoprotein n=1 Tax=Acrocarpospora phusangensis TaxID=1070424 RepID=A0A919UL63_9ACTN|nr:DUF305 domain-containing protein [Acrocarpospora phusangensis]GIH25801.1 lipoprotein [Acrocarpospora phusangensis]